MNRQEDRVRPSRSLFLRFTAFALLTSIPPILFISSLLLWRMENMTEQALNQLILQTERLEVTRQIFELDPDKSLQRELLLLKVECDNQNRAELREISSIYKAKIIDLSPDSMIFELTGKPDKIDAFLTMFKGYNILELCRTGVTALERGGKHEHMQKLAQEVGEAQLPLPGTHCH